MPIAPVNGVDLYYEETGQGIPLVWSHEFGGDHRSWEPQVRYFSRRYRVITYNHRGYAPSSVPKDAAAYSQAILVEDLYQLLRHLGVSQAHLAGCSMGGNVARDFALAHPEMLQSLIMVGAGAGTVNREQYLAGHAAGAAALDRDGQAARLKSFDALPQRASFKRKDPRGFAEFLRQAGEHDATACAHLTREVMAKRPTALDVEGKLRALRVPTLIMVGDEDSPCLEPSIIMRRLIPHSGLLVFPASGHTLNIEEPGLFNLHVAEFLAAVESDRWSDWQGAKR